MSPVKTHGHASERRPRRVLPAWLKIVRQSISTYERETLLAQHGVIRSARHVAELMKERAREEEVECVYVVALNATMHPVALQEIARGGLVNASVMPREVFRVAVLLNAYTLVLVHNHPSGTPNPSAEDITLTHALVEAGAVLGIPLADHVVVASGPDLSGGPGYFSFLEHGLL